MRTSSKRYSSTWGFGIRKPDRHPKWIRHQWLQNIISTIRILNFRCLIIIFMWTPNIRRPSRPDFWKISWVQGLTLLKFPRFPALLAWSSPLAQCRHPCPCSAQAPISRPTAEPTIPPRRDSRNFLDTQGQITYSLPSKKGLLITLSPHLTSPNIYPLLFTLLGDGMVRSIYRG